MESLYHAAGCCLVLLASCKSEAPPEPEPARTAASPASATAAERTPKKALLIQGIGADRSIVITVPSKTTLTMKDDGDDTLPRARLRGGGLTITVERPEAGFVSLAEEKAMLSRGAARIAFEHDLEVGDGYDLIYRSTDRDGRTLHAAIASRPVLGAICHAHQLKDRAAAVQALSICATMAEARTRPDAATVATSTTSADRTGAAGR